jgi:hypothetical protein
MLATAFHETNQTMQPVREAYWLSEAWRKQHLRYYPYYGRGYVQLTWKANYERASRYLGVDLVGSPDLAMNAGHAATVMYVGMTEGWFRKDSAGRVHNLARYFGGSANNPSGARNIINGREEKVIGGRTVLVADIVANYHDAFLRAIARGTVEQGVALRTEAAPSSTLPDTLSGLLDIGLETAPMLDEAPAEPVYDTTILGPTVDIVTTFIANNELAADAVPVLVADVYRTIRVLLAEGPAAPQPSLPADRPEESMPILPSELVPYPDSADGPGGQSAAGAAAVIHPEAKTRRRRRKA